MIEEKEFSKAMMKLWSEFAKSGAPENVTGLVLQVVVVHQPVYE